MRQSVECYPSSFSDRASSSVRQVSDTVHMEPVRLDVDTPSRRYAITLGDGILDRLPRLLDEAGAPRGASSSRARSSGACTDAACAAPYDRSRSSCPTASASSSCRRCRASTKRSSRERRPRLDAHHVRRRRHRRHGGLRRGNLPARHRARPRADDAAGAGGQRDRRQGRRQSRARQEPDRRVPPAARRRHRSVGARHAAPPGVPRRALRSDQVRHDVEPDAVRAHRPRAHGDLRARIPRSLSPSSASRAGSRPTSWRRTSAKPGRGGS